MSDLISRQAVEDLIMETDPFWCEGMTRAIFEGVKQLPSAEKRGKWKHDTDGHVWCYECGFGKERSDERPYHYCPNCGVRMTE